MSTVFFDEDDNAYCNPPCDALLIERRDGSMICSFCGKEYLPGSVKKHRRNLGPIDDGNNPLLVSMPEYGSNTKKKKPSVFDREDRYMTRSGFSWTDIEDLTPESEGERR